jgi:hypothetical protein
MSDSEISLLPAVFKIQKRWHLITLIAIVGGLLGWVISLARSPTYESVAVIGIGIDFSRTHPLSKEAQRHSLNRVRGLILADDVLNAVLEAAVEGSKGAQAPKEIPALRNQLRLEERESEWVLTARSEVPEAAALWASAWSQAVVAAISEALPHAIKAQEIQRELFEVGCQLVPSDSGEEDALWSCSLEGDDLVDRRIEQLLEEASLSRGIIPAITYTVLAEPSVAESPSRPGAGTWIAVGTMLGLLSGTLFVISRP